MRWDEMSLNKIVYNSIITGWSFDGSQKFIAVQIFSNGSGL